MSNQNSSACLLEQRDKIAIVTLNRPQALNTLSIETLCELADRFDYLSGQESIAAIVLYGLGEAFAAGADIKELLALTPTSAVDFSRLGGRLFNAMRFAPQLIIAAIDGYCMGGGLDLALACDLRYATTGATLAHPGARIGILTGFGGTRRLPMAVGTRAAEELFTTADRINGEQAFELGLVQALAMGKSALELAVARAESFAAKGPRFIAQLKTVARLCEARHPRRSLLVERYLELCREGKTTKTQRHKEE
jgi:enoyl-CoA hydratase/carnithine racemase